MKLQFLLYGVFMKRVLMTALLAMYGAGPAISAPIFNVTLLNYDDWAAKAATAQSFETFEQTHEDQLAMRDAFAFENGSEGRVIAATDTNGFAGFKFGELTSDGYFSAQVGSFTTVLGATGSGSTCRALSVTDSTCSDLALQYDPAVNGQGNTAPFDVPGSSIFSDSEFDAPGYWSLNSADTNGISWDVMLGGKEFDSAFFIIRDAADAGQQLLDVVAAIEVNGSTQKNIYGKSSLSNDNRLLVHIDFGETVTAANIKVTTSRNDGFTIDGAGISAVPLPAPALLLLTGLGGLAAFRRRKAA